MRPLPMAREPAPAPTIPRQFPPGSEWLYAKVYCPLGGIDELLRAQVRPLLSSLPPGTIDRWFFIRYADPRPHLRLRFQGRSQMLLETVLPALRARLAPLLATGRVASLDLGTYERELERYGGDSGMPICEEIFRVDSEAVVVAGGPSSSWMGAAWSASDGCGRSMECTGRSRISGWPWTIASASRKRSTRGSSESTAPTAARQTRPSPRVTGRSAAPSRLCWKDGGTSASGRSSTQNAVGGALLGVCSQAAARGRPAHHCAPGRSPGLTPAHVEQPSLENGSAKSGARPARVPGSIL